MEPERIVRSPPQGQRHICAVAEGLAQPAQAQRTGLVRLVGHEHRDQAVAIGNKVLPIEMAFRLAGALLAKRQQTAETRIGRAVGWIDENRWAVGEIEAAADNQPHPGRAGGFMGADDARQGVAINDRQRLNAERCGLSEEFVV